MLIASGQVFCWLYSIVLFICLAANIYIYSPLIAVTLFWSAISITIVLKDRGLKIYQIFLIYLISFMALILIIFVSLRQLYSFNTFILILFFGFSLFFWISGIRLSNKSIDYNVVADRFDLGIAIFFVLLIFKSIAKLEAPSIEYFLLPFFLLSVIALALEKSQALKFHSIKTISIFALFLTTIGGVVSLLFLPYLNTAANVGYSVIEDASSFLSPVFIRLFMFILRLWKGPSPLTDNMQIDREAGFANGDYTQSSNGWFFEYIGIILFWIMIIAGLFIFTALIFILLKYLYYYFTRETKNRKGQKSNLLLYIKSFFNFLYLNKPEGEKAYLMLLKWGNINGFTYSPSETPLEYGIRLSRYYPSFSKEISDIINCFNKEFYGRKKLKEKDLLCIKKAIRKIKNPYYWPLRLYVFFKRSMQY